jgi:hypothetical protein
LRAPLTSALAAAAVALSLAPLGGGCLSSDRIAHENPAGWEGGSGYYGRWPAGPPTDPSYFPLGVWLQNPANAQPYKDLGINMFMGLWEGPTDQQLADLQAAGLAAVAAQNATGLARAGAPVVSWMHDGESPDNAQPLPEGGYGPCREPRAVRATYAAMAEADRTRPVVLSLGPGIALDDWVGRGSACAGRLDMYPDYLEGADIAGFHIYPVNSDDPALQDKLWLVATAVDRLRAWSRYRKIVWATIETTAYADPARKPSPTEIKAQVWMALVHGAMGIVYYVHVFEPEFIEAGLLADPTTRDAVRDMNLQIRALAPVLNTPPLVGIASLTSSDVRVPIDFVVKRQGGATYLFAVAMRAGEARATVSLPGMSRGAVAEVLGEGRTIPIVDGTFQDGFAPFAVHLYKITDAAAP